MTQNRPSFSGSVDVVKGMPLAGLPQVFGESIIADLEFDQPCATLLETTHEEVLFVIYLSLRLIASQSIRQPATEVRVSSIPFLS
jgi:hypothetical protein